MKTETTLDTSGVVISSLCLIHCLLMPILGSFLPLIGVLSEIEWIHKALVFIALPICTSLLARSGKVYIRLLALFGISFLLIGAFIERFHEFEVILTMVGACSLSLAHFQNLRRRRHMH